MQKIKLWLMYQWYLGFTRFANRVLRFYYKFKGCKFDQMDLIHSGFQMSDDYVYAALITRYLISNCEYDDSARVDLIKDPEHFLFDRKGNCNDFSSAILSFLMRYKPYHEAHLMIVYAPEWRGHAVCCVQKNNKWFHCSNWGVQPDLHETLDQLASSIKSDWNYYVLVDEKLNLRRIVTR